MARKEDNLKNNTNDTNISNELDNKEVECPFCYATYDIRECGVSFQCSSCESILEVEFDEDGYPYIEDY